jgi:hypothetical protein
MHILFVIIDNYLLTVINDYIQTIFTECTKTIITNENESIIFDENTILLFVQKINDTIFSKMSNSDKQKCYLLNTEQLTRELLFDKVLADAIKIRKVIDYSPANIKILQSFIPRVNFYHAPPIFDPFIGTAVKNIPVLSLLNSPYRKFYGSKIVPLPVDFDGKFGDERNNLLARSKILVNIHFDPDFKIFESIRCYQALQYKTIVISEESIHSDIEIFNEFIIFVPKEKIPETVKHTLDNYYQVYSKIFSKENLKKIKKISTDNALTIEKLNLVKI